MKILFDQGTPVPLRRHLSGHTVDTAYERGWAALANGDLIAAAEQDGYGLLITATGGFVVWLITHYSLNATHDAQAVEAKANAAVSLKVIRISGSIQTSWWEGTGPQVAPTLRANIDVDLLNSSRASWQPSRMCVVSPHRPASRIRRPDL